ncbi:MAG: PTS sugar transporter subunit IIA [Anaerolineae bacterium]
MVHIVIVSHADVGEALIRAAEMIVGPKEGVCAVSLQPEDCPEALAERLTAVLEPLAGQEVLVLVDLFGGTPYNVSARQIMERGVECVTGVNLPMLLELLMCRDDMPASELAEMITQAGRESVKNLGPMFRKTLAANANQISADQE